MEQRSTARTGEAPQASGRLEEDLHRLSAETAQRVLERAIAEQAPDDPGLTRSDLLRIAQELDIDPTTVDRALAAELSATPQQHRRGLLARLTGLGLLHQRRVSDRPVPWVESAAASWLAGEEGLRLQRGTGQAGVWIADGRLAARMRLGLQPARGTRTLRAADRVLIEVRALGGGKSLVDLRADTSNLLGRGRTVLLAGTAAGFVLFLVGAMSGAIGDGAGAGILVALLSWTATVLTLRGWSRRLLAALTTAVEAISSSVARPTPLSWAATMTTLRGLSGQLWAALAAAVEVIASSATNPRSRS